MKLTRASNYAISAVVALSAQQEERTPVASHHTAAAQGIPERFLLKVLKPLVSAGLLQSVKGPHGGYRLARPANKITLLDIVEAVEGPIRGDAPMAQGNGTAGLDGRLQEICQQIADATRKHLGKIKSSDLAEKGGKR